MPKHLLALFICAFIAATAIAQDNNNDLFKLLDEENKKSDKEHTDYTTATFKTTRLINGHTIENTAKGILDVKISHRFETLNHGPKDLWGFDIAKMRFGFDYGLTDRLMIGIGRSTYQKQYDAFFKYKILRQSSGKVNMPVSLAFMTSVMVITDYPEPDSLNKYKFSNKLSYTYQLIAGRKFSDNTSLQIAPTFIHHNRVPEGSKNDVFAVGFGGRQKISKRVSINAEYYYVLPSTKTQPLDPNITYHNSLSVGFDIETGGHVFQLHFTNSRAMTESSFISETTGKWSEGDIHFGFNISRVFAIGAKKEKRKIQSK